MIKKEITIKQYNKIMDRLILLNKKVALQDTLIKLLDEATKYKIIPEKKHRKVGVKK
jgi:hypothetical protein